MTQKIYQTILKFGVYLAFLPIFFVFKHLFFPYITSKQFSFNILIEVLFIFWVAFIVKYPDNRPFGNTQGGSRKSYISFGLIAFFAAVLISGILGVDFNLSFWGDVERMLGFFQILHFLIFYFIVITVMRTWEDWRNLLGMSVLAALLVGLYSFKIPHSTIGNVAYVAGYMLFNIYFALILLFRSEKWLTKSALALTAIIMLFALKGTSVAGAYVGMAVSAFLFFFIYGVFNKNKKIKLSALLIFTFCIVGTILFFTNEESSFVQRNSFLKKVAYELSWDKNTFQTRLISWRAAAKDFPNHPFFGTGYGNYAITFDKYFDTRFYLETSSETYFDRAHNNLIDIASTTGMVGLLSYLSIFAAVGYYLIRGFRRQEISLVEFSLLVSLTAGYFIQNLAVFDSMVTYISLMIMLGFIYWHANKDEVIPDQKNDTVFSSKEIYALFISLVVIVTVLYQYNVKPLMMIKGVINGEIVLASVGPVEGIEAYKKALNYNTPLDRDGRSAFTRAVLKNSQKFDKIDVQKAREIFGLAIEQADKNVAYNPNDTLLQMELSQTLNMASTFYRDDKDKFAFYSARAEEAINKSIEASPGRVNTYFNKGQIYLNRGDVDGAIEILRQAVDLKPNYFESNCQLARLKIFYDKEGGYDDMDKCIDLGGASMLTPANFAKIVANHYEEKGDTERLLKVYEQLSILAPKDSEIWAGLANLYSQAKDIEKAKNAALKAVEANPEMKEAAEGFIRSLEAQQ